MNSPFGGIVPSENLILSEHSPVVVLGKFAENGRSYTKVAAHYEASYLKVKDWRTLSKDLSSDEMWSINEVFLDRQIAQGKQILLSHDPSKASGAYAREVRYLQRLGYEFEQNGWVWEAVK